MLLAFMYLSFDVTPKARCIGQDKANQASAWHSEKARPAFVCRRHGGLTRFPLVFLSSRPVSRLFSPPTAGGVTRRAGAAPRGRAGALSGEVERQSVHGLEGETRRRRRRRRCCCCPFLAVRAFRRLHTAVLLPLVAAVVFWYMAKHEWGRSSARLLGSLHTTSPRRAKSCGAACLLFTRAPRHLGCFSHI